MTRIGIIIAAGLALAATLPAAPALAQRDRVFVASYGSDSNPCTFGSPCKTFQNAVSVVAVGGEVTAIDSAGFGAISISHAVTITSPAGVEAGIVPSGSGDAIDINAPGAIVVLRGLTLEGSGADGDGINVASVGHLEIVDCSVHNFPFEGIYIQPSAPTTVLIENTVVTSDPAGENGTVGIQLQSNGGTIIAALDNVTVTDTQDGVLVDATSGTIEALISNSHIDNNSFIGVGAEGESTGSVSNVVLRNVTVNQTPEAIELGGFTTVYFSQVTTTHVPGFTDTDAVYFFPDTTDNAAYSDGTSHLSPTNGTIQTWTME
jgi:hypothetical protein